MSTIKYLPTPSEYSTRVAKILDTYEDLYLVGSAARKYLYNLNLTPKGYDFIISRDIYDFDETGSFLKTTWEKEFPGKVKWTNWGLEVDAEVLTVRVGVQPIDKFLRTVRFAGDGLGVSCQDDRPIVIPEYMSIPPVVAILKTEDTDDQNNKEWEASHLETLMKFQEELFRVVNEPTKS